MSIFFTCECGKSFQVKEELAGRHGKCPRCGQALTIPERAEHSESTAEAKKKPRPFIPLRDGEQRKKAGLIRFSCGCGETVRANKALAGKKAKCPNCGNVVVVPMAISQQEDIPPRIVDDWLHDDLERPPKSARTCPGCGKALSEYAVLCVACGLNLSTGEKLSTVYDSSPRLEETKFREEAGQALYDSYLPLEKRKFCEEAGHALTCAIMGLFCFGIILEPIAIAKALEAKKMIAANPRLTGSGTATAALTVGIIGFALSVLGLIATIGEFANM